jgi:hypothetical protein
VFHTHRIAFNSVNSLIIEQRKTTEERSINTIDMWQAGSLCEAQWSDGNYYKAKIKDVLYNGNFEVLYTEFHESDELTADRIRPHPDAPLIAKLVPGDVAEVMWTDGNYYRAKIRKVENKGLRFVVEFEGFGEVFTAENDQIKPLVQVAPPKPPPRPPIPTSNPNTPPIPSKSDISGVSSAPSSPRHSKSDDEAPSSSAVTKKARFAGLFKSMAPSQMDEKDIAAAPAVDQEALADLEVEPESQKKSSRLANLFRRNRSKITSGQFENFEIVEDASAPAPQPIPVVPIAAPNHALREEEAPKPFVQPAAPREPEVDEYAGMSPDEAKKLKKQKKRQKVLEEIVETERFYVQALDVMVNLWIKPLQESIKSEPSSLRSSVVGSDDESGPILPDKYVKLLFSNVELIHSLQANLLIDLEAVLEGRKNVGQVFLQCEFVICGNALC